MGFEKFSVGRAHDNRIVLNHKTVSRYHIDVFIDTDGRVFITDRGSSNGTFINGNRISGSHMLVRGDILKLGAEKPLPWEKWKPKGGAEGVSQDPLVPAHTRGDSTVGSVLTVVLLSSALLILIILVAYVLHNNYSKKNTRTETQVHEMSDDHSGTDNRDVVTTPVLPADPVKKDKTGNDNKSNPSDQNIPLDPDPSGNGRLKNSSITYDFTCLSNPNDKNSTVILNAGSDINDLVVDYYGDPVELSDEVKYGNELHNQLQSKYSFAAGAALDNLKHILDVLTSVLPDPRGFRYKLFLIKTDELNAFTAGGRIYVTTRMYNFCKSNDELACVLGHEIYHNELGHLKTNIKMASMPGAELLMLISTPFNQKKETACDFHGIDLAYRAGFDGCASVGVWKRMHQVADKGNYDPLENLFRSHPYSTEREECSRTHIAENYQGSTCVH